MTARGPLGYKPEIDDALMELGLIQWYDEDPSTLAVDRNYGVKLFREDGQTLPEWYDYG